ncbi:unnamed protein product [Pelagomonas calceolata]|uniref:Fe2OG dioxygenase domain-containing protein n=1 Tax=Pelagomonas calceolata TaxID=35677 RepID=A0A8J2WVR9_9STRA|nr:unnamed protein product [Pelagomonas calceolata]|mmetsp:Transcript_18029/g.51436  ORF Transcript_18029/g.51436 Transcript_18029/m.51436 type:complete len:309 (-) Transcript_18029:19-945(-)
MRLVLLVTIPLLLHSVVAAPSPRPRESFPLRPALGDLVNLERYPIGDLRSAEGRALVEKARSDLAATGCASFPCFLMEAALSDAVAEATAAAPSAFATDDTHNAYQLSTDAKLGPEHVRNKQMRTRVASTACDELDSSRAIRALYASDELLGLVKAITGKNAHRLADPLGAASINVFRSGWAHAWHYDESEFTVTLSLVQAAEGGAFEFTEPLRRSVDDLAFETTAAVINDHSEYAVEPAGAACPSVRTAPFAPGTLQIFAGRTSLHRVSEVKGERLVAVYCFSDIEGFVNSPEVQRMFWGRAVRPDR